MKDNPQWYLPWLVRPSQGTGSADSPPVHKPTGSSGTPVHTPVHTAVHNAVHTAAHTPVHKTVSHGGRAAHEAPSPHQPGVVRRRRSINQRGE